MAVRGRDLFSLYFYIENFKNLLVRKHWTDLNIIRQKCFFADPLQRLFKLSEFVKKHVCQGLGFIFPIFLYILSKNENFTWYYTDLYTFAFIIETLEVH